MLTRFHIIELFTERFKNNRVWTAGSSCALITSLLPNKNVFLKQLNNCKHWGAAYVMVMSESNAKNEILFYNFHSLYVACSSIQFGKKTWLWFERISPSVTFRWKHFFQTYLSLIFICFTNEIRSIKWINVST